MVLNEKLNVIDVNNSKFAQQQSETFGVQNALLRIILSIFFPTKRKASSQYTESLEFPPPSPPPPSIEKNHPL
jgi:hypothetical protein